MWFRAGTGVNARNIPEPSDHAEGETSFLEFMESRHRYQVAAIEVVPAGQPKPRSYFTRDEFYEIQIP
jgi:hypothetical protein